MLDRLFWQLLLVKTASVLILFPSSKLRNRLDIKVSEDPLVLAFYIQERKTRRQAEYTKAIARLYFDIRRKAPQNTKGR
mgnify:FL=1